MNTKIKWTAAVIIIILAISLIGNIVLATKFFSFKESIVGNSNIETKTNIIIENEDGEEIDNVKTDKAKFGWSLYELLTKQKDVAIEFNTSQIGHSIVSIDGIGGWKKQFWQITSSTDLFCRSEIGQKCSRGVDELTITQNNIYLLQLVNAQGLHDRN